MSSVTSAFLTIGSQAPNFSNVDALVGLTAGKLSLNDYKGKNLLMVFYPGEFSVVSASTFIDINDNLKLYTDLNTNVIAISSDKPVANLRLAKTKRQQGGYASKYGNNELVGKYGMDFPIVSDVD